MEYNLENNNTNINVTNNFIQLKNISNDTLIGKKKKLIEISKDLSKLEYLEIFNIIQEDNCIYSENKNGIFINLSNVNEKTIDKIFDFINFIKHKKEDLEKYEEYIDLTSKNVNQLKTTKENMVIQKNDNTNTFYENESDSDEIQSKSSYLMFSSDEDENVENKITLKKKKIKYSGKKAKIIKLIKDNNDIKNNI